MISWHKVGQKILCIKEIKNNENGEIVPSLGKIYTIRDVEIFDEKSVFLLEEIKNRRIHYYDGFKECTFYSSYFSPLYPKQIVNLKKFWLDPPRELLEREKELVD